MHFEKLVKFSNGLIRNEPEAKDIAINSLYKLFVRRTQFSNLGQIKAFLYVAARNSSIDYLRSLRRFSSAMTQYATLKDDDDDTPYDAYVSFALPQAIETLPPMSRKVIELLYFQGLSYVEVAQKLNTTKKNVKNMRAYALKRLRKYFEHIPSY